LREAFSAYTLFKQIVQNHLEDSSRLNTVLDFGCGWGRIIRFFLKDIEPSDLWGIDCAAEVIEICKQTNKWCKFELIDPFPPTSFPDGTFDLIYCYSVFSHLSEEAHRKWLVEFRRILRPGGLLIATTWHREFIMRCAELRKQENRPVWLSGQARSFLDTAQVLSDYDSGKYLHSPVGGGGILDPSFFGETCIPKGYVLSHWTKHFKFLDFIDDRNLCSQNVIVVKK
jgi:ubiquinone/menaquinone biosynthesis C-methylase UbiE